MESNCESVNLNSYKKTSKSRVVGSTGLFLIFTVLLWKVSRYLVSRVFDHGWIIT
jgi:hypothetical protein